MTTEQGQIREPLEGRALDEYLAYHTGAETSHAPEFIDGMYREGRRGGLTYTTNPAPTPRPASRRMFKAELR